MKLIIAGSRDITDKYAVVDALTSAFHEWGITISDITEEVSGCAPGVDSIGEKWAEGFRIPVKRFPYRSELGKAGGPVRNREMSEYCDRAVVVTNGSRGAASMIREMKRVGKPCFVYEVK